MNRILIIFFISLAAAIIAIMLTRYSRLDKQTKVTLYILSLLMPAVGLILYFVFSAQQKKQV